MIRAFSLLAALCLVCACAREDAETTAAPAPPAKAASARPSATPQAASMGTAMTGEVSGLTADRSGLNVRVTEFGTVVDLPSDALFEYDKADLTPAAEAELRKAAELVRRSPAGPVQIIGHTDSHGDEAYNQALSEARARAVADWLGSQVGVRQRAFEVSGRGENAPIAPNTTASGADDPAGRSKNRRVEIVLPRG